MATVVTILNTSASLSRVGRRPLRPVLKQCLEPAVFLTWCDMAMIWCFVDAGKNSQSTSIIESHFANARWWSRVLDQVQLLIIIPLSCSSAWLGFLCAINAHYVKTWRLFIYGCKTFELAFTSGCGGGLVISKFSGNHEVLGSTPANSKYFADNMPLQH